MRVVLTLNTHVSSNMADWSLMMRSGIGIWILSDLLSNRCCCKNVLFLHYTFSEPRNLQHFDKYGTSNVLQTFFACSLYFWNVTQHLKFQVSARSEKWCDRTSWHDNLKLTCTLNQFTKMDRQQDAKRTHDIFTVHPPHPCRWYRVCFCRCTAISPAPPHKETKRKDHQRQHLSRFTLPIPLRIQYIPRNPSSIPHTVSLSLNRMSWRSTRSWTRRQKDQRLNLMAHSILTVHGIARIALIVEVVVAVAVPDIDLLVDSLSPETQQIENDPDQKHK